MGYHGLFEQNVRKAEETTMAEQNEVSHQDQGKPGICDRHQKPMRKVAFGYAGEPRRTKDFCMDCYTENSGKNSWEDKLPNGMPYDLSVFSSRLGFPE